MILTRGNRCEPGRRGLVRDRRGVRCRLALLLASLLVPAGCAKPPQFALNLEGREPASVSKEQAAAIRQTLEKLFGTPDEPKVPAGVHLDRPRLATAAGPIGGEADGTQRGLYRRHCVTCHGISGDGAGPTASLLDPYPRDFRNGIFKYTSTRGGAKPLKKDLHRTLFRGVTGTAMPSFAQLPPEELDALVEYVAYLSLRGETELYLLQLVADENAPLPVDLNQVLEEGVQPVVEQWNLSQRDPSLVVVVPLPLPTGAPEQRAAVIAKGRELYLSKNAQCVKCHGENGDGKGEETELYDDWNKRKKGVTAEQTQQLARLFTLPIQRLRPRDFRQGIFRGGARHDDLFLRIHSGIKGTPMPPTGPGPGTPGVLAPEEISQVVEFIRSLAAAR